MFVCTSLLAFAVTSCAGGGKQDIPLVSGQTYKLQASGKINVFPAAATGADGAAPLNHLRVKRKNAGPAAATSGCWACTDCICNSDDCACTECTAC
jgi:hypothetical protein